MAFTAGEEITLRSILSAFENGKKISDLTAATTVSETDVLNIVQGGISKKVSASVMSEFFGLAEAGGGIVVTVGKNKLDKSKLVTAIFNLDGSLYTGTEAVNFRVSDYMPISPDSNVILNQAGYLCEYDSNRVIVPNGYHAYSEVTPFVTSPTTKYVRSCSYYTGIDTVQFEYGTVSTGYEAYYETVTGGDPITPSTWGGLGWLALGDSLTAAAGSSDGRGYAEDTAVNLGMTLTNSSKGGITMTQIIDGDGAGRAALTSADFVGKSLVTILTGMNNRETTLGVIGDLYPTQSTFYGMYNYVITKIFELSADKHIRVVGILPHKAGKYAWVDVDADGEYPVGSGHNEYTFVTAMRECCIKKGLPYVDMYTLSGINEFNWNVLTACTLGSEGSPYPLNPENAHPNDAGYARYTAVLSGFLRSIQPLD